MRTLRHVIMALVTALSSREVADARSGIQYWWQILLILAAPAATIAMNRRVRGVWLFLWLFSAGTIVLVEIVVGETPMSVPPVAYGLVLFALGWYIKFREAPAKQDK
jgi:hypothetical protein